MTLLLVLTVIFSFADSTKYNYENKDIEALEIICKGKEDLEDVLLCHYRLFPLTRDQEYIESIPTEPNSNSARALALASGLWGFRAAEAPLLSVIKYGRRAEQFMRRAMAIDQDDPFVLLISGQSLLFKPAIAGGDKHAALKKFKRLKEVLSQKPMSGVSEMEAEVWLWYTLDKLNKPEADDYRSELLSKHPPRLLKEFLLDPP